VIGALRKLALDYHHRTSRLPYGERIVASLARQIGHADSLLDIGCGDGLNTLTLAKAIGATRVAGVDVHVRPTAQIEVREYDGLHIPFPDRSFDIVSLVDVLHHCSDPDAVLAETMRVACKLVVIKDHFQFGPVTNKVLYWIDRVGNAKDGIPCPGTYFQPHEWVAMVERAGGHIARLEWPLKTHDLPWRIVGWPQLQFTAKVVPNGA
jgi:SAM-dependent methyltransferase